MPQYRDYFLDRTNENARLLHQHEQFKALIGGRLVPPEVDVSTARRVLDLACGPGGWALDFARTYPQAQVIGVDASEIPLGEARRLAIRDHLSNALFREMDLTNPAGLPFPDASFDLVWARVVFMHLPVASWEPLLREIYRVLRPDGAFVALDTDATSGSHSSPKVRQLTELLTTLLLKAGRMPRFGALGPGLLRRAGFERLYTHPLIHSLTFQQGDVPVPEDVHQAQLNALSGIYNARAAMVHMGLITAEEFDELFEAVIQEFEHDPDQVAVGIDFLLSARKPGERDS
jgi:ubiquinone/menaquinone biosynthesis C-methylase UbiE